VQQQDQRRGQVADGERHVRVDGSDLRRQQELSHEWHDQRRGLPALDLHVADQDDREQ
jgi:hypothetical protein